tara:strand:+ start:2069 stop:2755 length:687 start_codon:yes stop_codon:yes gene_type:complete
MTERENKTTNILLGIVIFIIGTILIVTGCIKKDILAPKVSIAEEIYNTIQNNSSHKDLLNLSLEDIEGARREVPTKAFTDSITISDYSCIRIGWLAYEDVFVCTDMETFMNFLPVYDAPEKIAIPSPWNLNGDTTVDTEDLLILISGFGIEQPEYPPFSDHNIYDSFGEGNTWYEYVGEDSEYQFAWLHRTNGDEEYNGNYLGFDLNSFRWEQIRTDSATTSYTFIRK